MPQKGPVELIQRVKINRSYIFTGNGFIKFNPDGPGLIWWGIFLCEIPYPR